MKRRIIVFLFIFFISFSFISFQNYDNEEKIISEIEILIKEGNYSKALNILLTELNNSNKKSAKLCEKAASIFFTQQVYDLALKYYLLAYKNGLTEVEILEKIGETYAYLNDDKKAISYLKKAFYLGNSDPYYLYSLIWVLLKQKKFEEAYSLLDLGYSLYPNLSYFIGAKALYYANTYDIENARKEYEKVLIMTALYSPIYFYNWGVMEYELRNFIEAENLFSQAATFSTFGEAFLALGEISLGKLELNSAESYFMKGKPLLKSPFILYDLIYLYVLKGDKEKLISVHKSILKFPNKWWIYQYNLNLNEQLLDFYELESYYFKNLIILEKKSFYIDFADRIKSKFKIIKYYISMQISKLKSRYYATLHLSNIDKNKESINYLQIARKIVKGFPFIEAKLILLEKTLYESATKYDGYIYNLYYAEKIKSNRKKELLLNDFLKKADPAYEKLDILNALVLSAKIKKNNLSEYIRIIANIGNIYPQFFETVELQIPVSLKLIGENKNKKLIKSFLRKKDFINNKKSELKLEVDCGEIFTFIIEYKGKSHFFSLTKEDILNDRISIYSNILRVFQTN